MDDDQEDEASSSSATDHAAAAEEGDDNDNYNDNDHDKEESRPTYISLNEEDPEKVRMKRLARLATAAAAATAPATTTTSTPPAGDRNGPRKAASSPPAKSDLMTMAMDMDVSPKPPLQMPLPLSEKRESGVATPQWENSVMTETLHVTLNEMSKRTDLLFLRSLRDELVSENAADPTALSMELADRVMVARLSLYSESQELSDDDASLFPYLLKCYDSALQEYRRLGDGPSEKHSKLRSLMTLIVSYAGLVLQEPYMFPQPQVAVAKAYPSLIDRFLGGTMEQDFLVDFIYRFQNDGLEQIFGPVIMSISAEARGQSLSRNFSSPVRALWQLCQFKEFVQQMVDSPSWIPHGANAREMEMSSYLGPFLRLSAFDFDDSELTKSHFGRVQRTSEASVQASVNTVRGVVKGLQTTLFDVVKQILKASAEARERMLSYFGVVLRVNEKRAQMHVNPMMVSSEGFMFNLTMILLQLCEPFLDANSPKFALIDPEYLLRSKRVDLTKETRLAVTSEEIDRWTKQQMATEYAPNFISESFFLTALFLHFGPLRTLFVFFRVNQQLGELQASFQRARAAVGGDLRNPLIEQHQHQLDYTIRVQLSMDVYVLDPDFLFRTIRFYNLFLTWLTRLADPSNSGRISSAEVPFAFVSTPECFLEDVADFFLFVLRAVPSTISVFQLNELMTFTILFLNRTDYFKNPYVRSKFTEVLFMLSPTGQERSSAPNAMLAQIFDTHPLALESLVSVLMNFYQEVENTGDAHQFYEKFSIRYHISSVFEYLWTNATHRKRFREESRANAKFVRFVNLLLNDTTFLLDESLTKLTAIHTAQERMSQPTWGQLPQAEREEEEKNLRTNENQCRSLMFLGNVTIKFLHYLTTEIVEPFLAPEIIDRLVAMLNYNVHMLVGPKCTELKVKNPEKYGFDPKKLLANILDLYLHLKSPAFAEAMAREGRSYSKQIFAKAVSILRKFALRSEVDIEDIEKLVVEVEAVIQAGALAEEELGEIPDEFLDPITFTLMKDPVLLPTSGIIVDRATIASHLLSDSIDPFNRKHLTLDMVEPSVELKTKIEEFLRKAKSPGRHHDAAGSQAGDGSMMQ